MKGCDIKAVISVTPDARFALKPNAETKQVIELRNLKSVGSRTWRCRGRMNGCDWTAMQVQSRQICTVEDAARLVADTVARDKAYAKGKARATAVVHRLRAFHVGARCIGQRVVVDDVEGLDRILDCVHGKLKEAARSKRPSDLCSYFCENGYACTFGASSERVLTIMNFDCGAVISFFKSGTATMQGLLPGEQRSAIVELAKSAGWAVH